MYFYFSYLSFSVLICNSMVTLLNKLHSLAIAPHVKILKGSDLLVMVKSKVEHSIL